MKRFLMVLCLSGMTYLAVTTPVSCNQQMFNAMKLNVPGVLRPLPRVDRQVGGQAGMVLQRRGTMRGIAGALTMESPVVKPDVLVAGGGIVPGGL